MMLVISRSSLFPFISKAKQSLLLMLPYIASNSK
jgi:hypothetical protein